MLSKNSPNGNKWPPAVKRGLTFRGGPVRNTFLPNETRFLLNPHRHDKYRISSTCQFERSSQCLADSSKLFNARMIKLPHSCLFVLLGFHYFQPRKQVIAYGCKCSFHALCPPRSVARLGDFKPFGFLWTVITFLPKLAKTCKHLVTLDLL